MRKKIMNFTALAVILLLAACSNQDEVLTNNDDATSVRTLTLSASMPKVEEPATRLALDPVAKDVLLTWQIGDVIELVFVHDVASVSTKTKISTTVSSVSSNGKVATFNIVLPAAVVAPTFNLYGVHGGGGLNPQDLTQARLPGRPDLSTSLNNNNEFSIQNRGDVMLYFREEGISSADLAANVEFKHVGSLFALSLNNIDQAAVDLITSLGIGEARLVGTDPANRKWAYNSADCGQYFDLETEEFLNLGSANNYLAYKFTGFTITPVNEIITLWGWYPMPNIVWPAMRLQIIGIDGLVKAISGNVKASRATAPAAGKTYHFYASVVGGGLSFTNDQFVLLP